MRYTRIRSIQADKDGRFFINLLSEKVTLPRDLANHSRIFMAADAKLEDGSEVTADFHIKFDDEGITVEILGEGGDIVAETSALYSELFIPEDGDD